MKDNYQCNIQYIPYKEIAKQKAIEYYHKNIEKIKEKNKNKYNLLSPKEKKKQQEFNKDWFKKQPVEKQKELREKAKQYHKNGYHSLMIAVN